jgi:hypothetical protein
MSADCEGPALYTNHFVHCGVRWTDTWSCQCDDDCPRCGREIEPWASQSEEEFTIHVPPEWVPENGWPVGIANIEELKAAVTA